MADDRQPGNSRIANDEDTGKSFAVKPEGWHDRWAAWLSILYLLAMLVVLSSGLFQIWIGNYSLLQGIVGNDKASLRSALFRLMAYTAIGGALGAIANGIRSIIYWHLEVQGFGGRFIWKYLSLPPLGALLAVMVYATIRAGIGAVGGNFGQSEGGAQSMLAFALGALSGYGSHKVFIWLDDKVTKLFAVSEKKVPDLMGKSQPEAEATLKTADLTVGKVETAPAADPGKTGKVIDQTPAPGLPIAAKGVVNITIGAPGARVPDLKGESQPEAEATPKTADSTVGKVETALAADPGMEEKVTKQDSAPESIVASKAAVGITIAMGKQ